VLYVELPHNISAGLTDMHISLFRTLIKVNLKTGLELIRPVHGNSHKTESL